MKKIIVLCAFAWFAAIATQAKGYAYIVFQQSSGAVQAVESDGLKITFQNGNLIATPKTGEQLSLSLADLSTMRFADEDVTAIGSPAAESGVSVSGSSIVVSLNANSWARVFTPAGVAVAQFGTAGAADTFATQALKGGVYIVKTNNTTTKILVK